ncbi:MAG: gliding motility lipoprotein GldH [Methanosarcinaceae archaeon]
MKKFIIPIIIAFLLMGCNSNIIFREYKKFDDVSWSKFDILDFEFTVQRKESLDFYLALRHHTDFPYSFIDVNVTFFTPNGEMRSRDYHFRLKNTKREWKGNGMGQLWDVELPIRKGMIFKKSGNCKVRIENKMNKAETPGIIEVGLIVRKTE